MTQDPARFPLDAIVGLGFVLACIAATALLTVSFGDEWLTWWRARDWSPATCTIERTADEPGGLRYGYEVGSNRHASADVGIGMGEPAAAVAYARGSTVPCWVDPAEPARALLDRDYPWWWALPGAWALCGLFLPAAGRGTRVIVRWVLHRPEPGLPWGRWLATLHRHGAWKTSLAGAVFLALGLGLTSALTVLPWWNWWRAQSWTPSTCVMVPGEVVRHLGRFARKSYTVMHVAFAYQTLGRQYVSRTYSPWAGGSVNWQLDAPRRVESDRIIETRPEFALGTEHRCYVSPDAPEEAYIERGWWNGWFAIAPIGPGFLLFGMAIVASRPRRARGRRVSDRSGKSG